MQSLKQTMAHLKITMASAGSGTHKLIVLRRDLEGATKQGILGSTHFSSKVFLLSNALNPEADRAQRVL